MEGSGGSGFNNSTAVTKKRRSITIRRPRPDSQFILDGSPPSSTPSSENASKHSPDDNVSYDGGSKRKDFNLNSSVQKVASLSKIESLASSRKSKKDDRKFGDVEGFYGSGSSRSGNGSDSKRCSEGVLAPANWKSMSKVKDSYETRSSSPDVVTGKSGEGQNLGSSVGASTSNRVKVKLKVGGVTRTIHTKSTLDTANDGSSRKPSRSSDPSRHRQKLILQDDCDDDLAPQDGIGWTESGHSVKEGSRIKGHGSVSMRRSDDPELYNEPVRKSKRVPKRRVLDDGDQDNEVRNLERHKLSKSVTNSVAEYEVEGEESSKKRKLSKFSKARRTSYEVDDDYMSHRRKGKTDGELDDTDFVEEEERASDEAHDSRKRKQKRESVETIPETRAEPLTTRQRALQSGRGAGTPFIEFPNGLPPAPPRKQKEKLSEVELQAKKEEAARRRKMQVEKQNREIRAAAISKILGHDSKKKTSKEEEKAQEKAAQDLVLAPSTVRCVTGPSGTIVTFADDVGLPSIFNSKPCSYPPPREKCAGPSCTNPYKYRDSKSNLPLCSLQCYRVVQGSTEPVSTR